MCAKLDKHDFIANISHLFHVEAFISIDRYSQGET